MKMMTFDAFINERVAIRDRKNAGMPRPWSEDYILANTRFTNIDRNDDRGTIELFKKVKGFGQWPTVYTTVLYRTCYSSLLFLGQLNGVADHDIEVVKSLYYSKITTRMPYNVWLYGGETMAGYLLTTAMPVAHYINNHIDTWFNRSILAAGNTIADVYATTTDRRMLFLGTEIAKDLSVLFPSAIDPDSICRLNTGALKGLKRLKTNTPELLKSTGLNYSALEHALCEYNKYCHRWANRDNLRRAWMY